MADAIAEQQDMTVDPSKIQSADRLEVVDSSAITQTNQLVASADKLTIHQATKSNQPVTTGSTKAADRPRQLMSSDFLLETDNTDCIKYLLLGFNVVVFHIGIGMLVTGTQLHVVLEDYEILTEGDLVHSSLALVILGTGISLIALLGCCGTWYHIKFALWIYSFVLLAISLSLLVIGIFAFVSKNDIRDKLKSEIFKHLQCYNNRSENTTDNCVGRWDNIQQTLECCGVNGPVDWMNISDFSDGEVWYTPDSCCIEPTPGCGENNDDSKYSSGCYAKFNRFLSKNAGIIAAVGISVAMVPSIGSCLTCCLLQILHKRSTRLVC